jgi:beta-mannanase
MRTVGSILTLLLPLALHGPAQAKETAGQNRGESGAVQSFVEALDKNGMSFGVYDPHSAFQGERDVDIEHMFVYWQALDVDALRSRLDYASRHSRKMMVTVEPYTRAVNWRDGGEHLFKDIISGKFRTEINRVCSELADFDGSVLVRWGHEMEDPTGRYPWARKDNEGFKSAFRHFVGSCKSVAQNVSFVWSPKGEKNLADYYPGDDVVDLVGVSLWGLEKMDEKYYGGWRDFSSTFTEKYDRVAQFGKPVIIAELGVSGKSDYRENWFSNLFETVSSSEHFRQLRAIVYFNDKEPHYWPLGLGSPDWRLPGASSWFSTAKQAAKGFY